ncbi:hypothetical protein [Arundinibacter roseus]|uniref:Uncharacterized protein n=1 Tax=Arundinibacter roseus TaxID=2070510 RepID=A0A4R4KCP3_9BACT|nr:hypothetical protein [Arundinibacter roseus]TDB64602.1 hypothetical protein EZE20_13100 [Arundinibacter roseus]
MKKITYSIIALAGLFFISQAANAQSNKVTVDPGISVNNYKHPNKARQAKAMTAETEGTTANAIVEPRKGNRFNGTPKYANRPGSKVFLGTEPGKDFHLNPLNAPGHYKTPSNGARNEEAEIRLAGKNQSKMTDDSIRVD